MSKERRKIVIASSLFDGIEDSRIRYVLAILQDEDADPNYLLHERGIAPIHMAIGHESKSFAFEVTTILLQYGANPNLCSTEGVTPVHIASAWGRARLLQLLLLNGGNPWLEDDEGKNAFHFAFEENHTNAMQVLEDFRSKDSGKFDEWSELCDPNPKYKIALDKVLLYNREVLLSYQANVPFAARELRTATTQTSPPDSPRPPTPEEQPLPPSRPMPGPVAASTSAIDRFNFVLSDIRNKVVSQVTLRKVTKRPLSRRTTVAPAPTGLTFLDELRQRQQAGLRHAATQMSPPARPETRLVRDEVMVRVSPSPMPSGDESCGSDEFESRLDRAFRHMEVDAAITGPLEPADEWEEYNTEAMGQSVEEVESAADERDTANDAGPSELRLDLRRLSELDELNCDADANVGNVQDHCISHEDNFLTVDGCNNDASYVSSAPQDDIPYGIHDSSFGVRHTSFGVNYVTAIESFNNSSVGPGCAALVRTNNETCENIPNGMNDALLIEENEVPGENQALLNEGNSISSEKSAWFGMKNNAPSDSPDNTTRHSPSPDLFESRLSAEVSRDMYSSRSYDDTAAAVADELEDSCAVSTNEEPVEPFKEGNSNSYHENPEMSSLLMVTARSRLSVSSANAFAKHPSVLNASAVSFNMNSNNGADTSDTNASVINESAINNDEINVSPDNCSGKDQEPCAKESSTGNFQSREDSCHVVWENVMDASESFFSCPEASALAGNNSLGKDAVGNNSLGKDAVGNGSQRREDIAEHSFASIAEEASMAFISDDEEQFDEPPGECDIDAGATADRDDVIIPIDSIYDLNVQANPASKAAANQRSSWSPDSSVSASEEYVYTDEEEGVVLVERRFLVPPSSGVDDSSDGSLPAELEGYDTDRLRKELVKHGVEPGPIVPSTKRVYLKKLQRAARGKAEPGHKQTYSCELDRSLRDDTWTIDLVQYEALEKEMSAPFARADPRKCWREGVLKSSFCYLLLDPRISANLPCRAATTPPAEAWATFLEAVFYVGKGKRSRPYSHLYQAVGIWQAGGRARDAKTQQILDIWAAGLGVVCLHVFQNVIPVEAYTREAAMLDALTLGRVRNARRSEYYGVAASWPAKRRNMLGTLLLHKAMRIFFSEGERQLRPGDIRH